MRIICHPSNDVYFHLAAEAYLLEHGNEDITLLWQSHNAVVCGKHQVVLKEVDYPYCRRNNIHIARRISGGGTVFHDAGNLCFSFIKSYTERQQAVDFRSHTQPLVDLLVSLGVPAEHSGRNDILAGGLKISGNAEHLNQRRQKVLHHGTLLFNSDLENLGRAIHGHVSSYSHHGVESVRSKVANISGFLKNPMSLEHFLAHIAEYLADYFTNSRQDVFSQEEIAQIIHLRDTQFKQEDWIFGYGPRYSFTRVSETPAGTLDCHLAVEKGVILEARLSLNRVLLEAVSEELRGASHHAPDWNNLSLLLPPGIPLETFEENLY
jgi:lipoate-protein ligase A